MFFSKKKNENDNTYLIKVAALLIHAARIDEKYSIEEEEIIKKALLELGTEQNELDAIINKAKQCEENANQILDFTKEIKSLQEEDKIKIVRSLWKIIYSNKDEDMYESNLMRRLSGLLYIDYKIMGNIKEKIKKEYLK